MTAGESIRTSGAFRRDLSALESVLDLADAFAAKASLTPRRRADIEFVLDELFTNCVRHNASGGGCIEIELDLRDRDIVVNLIDRDAPPFDPIRDAPQIDVAAPLDERSTSGLGLHLVRKLVDRVEYAYHDRTSTITLFKRTE